MEFHVEILWFPDAIFSLFLSNLVAIQFLLDLQNIVQLRFRNERVVLLLVFKQFQEFKGAIQDLACLHIILEELRVLVFGGVLLLKALIFLCSLHI